MFPRRREAKNGVILPRLTGQNHANLNFLPIFLFPEAADEPDLHGLGQGNVEHQLPAKLAFYLACIQL